MTHYTEDLDTAAARAEAARIIEAAGIRAHVTPAKLVRADPNRKDGWTQEHYLYTVDFESTTDEARASISWHTGTGVPASYVNPAEVLATVCADGLETEHQSFEGWAADTGYDPDSRKAEAIFKTFALMLAEVNALLPDSEDVERLAELHSMF